MRQRSVYFAPAGVYSLHVTNSMQPEAGCCRDGLLCRYSGSRFNRSLRDWWLHRLVVIVCLSCCCTAGAVCMADSDCSSHICTTGHVCASPTCSDGVLNGDETCTDAGGLCPAKCDAGDDCFSSTDCSSGVCDDTTWQCAEAACDDGVWNGDEGGSDCGGSCPSRY